MPKRTCPAHKQAGVKLGTVAKEAQWWIDWQRQYSHAMFERAKAFYHAREKGLPPGN